MSSRTLIVRVFVFLSWILLALPLWAQEARWTELNRRVEMLSSQGKYAEALPLARNALEVAERLFGPEDVRTAVSAMSLANAERELGKDADAESLYKRSLAIREKALGPDHQDVAESLNDLA